MRKRIELQSWRAGAWVADRCGAPAFSGMVRGGGEMSMLLAERHPCVQHFMEAFLMVPQCSSIC